jgi:type II secretory pathway component PulF
MNIQPLMLRAKKITGIMDAESALAARQKLRTAGNFPTSVEEALDSSATTKTKKKGSSFCFTTVYTYSANRHFNDDAAARYTH